MDNFKTLMVGAVMFIVGTVVGYKICEKQLAEAYREDLEDVIQRTKKYDDEVGGDVDSQDVSEEDVILFQRKKDEENTEERKIDYTKFVKPNIFIYADEMQVDGEDEGDDEDPSEEDYEAEQDPEDIDIEDIDAKYDNDEYEDEPFLIMEEYYHELLNDGAEGQLLFYYSKDGVVCEEDDSIVEKHSTILGTEFEDVLNTDTVVWVKNPALNTMYEIRKIDGSYLEEVSNAIETPRERSFRHAGRIKKAIDGE